MRRPDQRAGRLVAAVLVAALLVNYPVLAVVESVAGTVALPLVPLWLVLVWAGLIGVVARLTARATPER